MRGARPRPGGSCRRAPPRTAFVLRDGRLYPLPSPSVLGIPTTLAALCAIRPAGLAARARAWRSSRSIPAPRGRRRIGRGRSSGAASAPRPSTSSPSRCSAASMPATSSSCRCSRCFRGWSQAAERQRGSVAAQPRARPHAPRRACSARCAAGWRSSSTRSSSALPPAPLRSNAAVTAIERRRIGMDGRPPARDRLDAAAVILAAPAHAAATLLRPVDADAARHLCDRCRTSRRPASRSAGTARDVAHPLAGSGFVVARRHNDAAHHRVHVGLVEVGRSRARRTRCCCARSSAARTIPTRSISTTTS